MTDTVPFAPPPIESPDTVAWLAAICNTSPTGRITIPVKAFREVIAARKRFALEVYQTEDRQSLVLALVPNAAATPTPQPVKLTLPSGGEITLNGTAPSA